MNKLTITGVLICCELLIGGLLGRSYISQYSFLTSEESLGQFFATVIFIYSLTVFLLGAINLRLTKKLEKKIMLRCIANSLILATIFAVPILFLPYRIVNKLDIWDFSPFVMILLGLVIGFNYQLLKAKSPSDTTQQDI